jgi:thioredoxin 1
MPSPLPYAAEPPTREAIDALAGATLLEFGTDWCGYCCAAESVVSAALAGHPKVKHLKVEDGSGRPLGRSYRIKLWPTLIFLDNGKEVARLVRPTDTAAVAQALSHIDLRSGDQQHTR